MLNEIVEIHAVCKGQVQGVGFRATAQHYAKNLGLIGSARNLEDGSVEIFVKGKKSVVDQFFNSLRSHFPKEYVKELTLRKIQTSSLYQGFKILS